MAATRKSRRSKLEFRALLKAQGLRATHPRLEVLRILEESDGPLSYTEVQSRLREAEWDRATTFRNLVRLRDAGLAIVVSRVEGIDRYALTSGDREGEDAHGHAHFLCDDCGRVTCLPDEITQSLGSRGRWAKSVRAAKVQLRGPCPECI